MRRAGLLCVGLIGCHTTAPLNGDQDLAMGAGDAAALVDQAAPADQAAAPSCSDGTKNGGETDVDCGGPCTQKCGVGKMCAAPGDCGTGVCTMGICIDASCSDGIKNGNETDVDCGGGCPGCAVGKSCKVAGDCLANGACVNGACACAPSFYGNGCLPYTSCYELHQKDPNFATGLATIDTDGPGGNPQFPVWCDMTMQGGGWTRLVKHVAAAGFFGDDATGRNSNAGDPTNSLYSILGKADLFKRNNQWEFLYWNRQFDKWVTSTQTSSALDGTKIGGCKTGNAVTGSNYVVGGGLNYFCGYTPGPVGWSVVNGYGPNWTHSAGQLKVYANWPLVCTYNDGYMCNAIEFYVR